MLSISPAAKVENQLFSKVLVANRGEIACRVIETCKKLNIRTVAVYSDADRLAQHVQLADEAYHLGGSAARESYLNIDKILKVCKENNVEAVHPGYGFLSENADFSAACKAIGVEFIGPPEPAIISMGSKSESKRIMLDAKVPCTPGYHGDDQSLETLKTEAKSIGYPVMLKAVMGGGGKGMRIVHKEEELEENIESCKREALSSFNDERILIEKYLVGTRHIELQVFADKYGNCVHFFERDCSVQRRHQKILEEAPAPFLPEELRMKMGEAAVNAAKAVNYVGAGTVEFMLDCNEQKVTSETPFYFMEMNTRLQVEHPVTELITGVDLVELQLKIASGQSLPYEQSELKINGHALEARIYAENPSANFLPGSGKLKYLKIPVGDGIRVDTGVKEKDEVSVHYDPMISKLIVHGKSREEALKTMKLALDEYHVGGLNTNISFVTKCINSIDFKAGGVTTKFIENNESTLLANNENTRDKLFFKAASLKFIKDCFKQNNGKVNKMFGFRNVGVAKMNRIYEVFSSDFKDSLLIKFKVEFNMNTTGSNEVDFIFTNEENGEVLKLSGRQQVGGRNLFIQEDIQKTNAIVVNTDDSSSKSAYIYRGVSEADDFANTVYRVKDHEVDYKASGSVGTGKLVAPMPGKIVKVEFAEGDDVKTGEIVVAMEAMKMEHVLKSPVDGKIKSLFVSNGDFVTDGATLCVIE